MDTLVHSRFREKIRKEQTSQDKNNQDGLLDSQAAPSLVTARHHTTTTTTFRPTQP